MNGSVAREYYEVVFCRLRVGQSLSCEVLGLVGGSTVCGVAVSEW